MFASRYVRAFIVFALPAALASAAELTVLSVSPPANAVSAPNYAPIVVNRRETRAACRCHAPRRQNRGKSFPGPGHTRAASTPHQAAI